jgi:hypothetical protein
VLAYLSGHAQGCFPYLSRRSEQILMKSRKITDEVVGRFRILLEQIDGNPGVHDYGLPRMAWIRAVQFMDHYGLEKALHVIDERAERAADRGDYETARRWRNLIAAIHAIENDERLLGENVH